MSGWSAAELDRIGRTEELDIASELRDGTETKPVTIWIVRTGDEVYVRSAVRFGRAAWYRATRETHRGRISLRGLKKEVSFEDVGTKGRVDIDAAYWKKYGRYAKSIVEPCVGAEATATTIKLVPR